MTDTWQEKSGWQKPATHGRYAISDKDASPESLRLRLLCIDRPPVELILSEVLLPGAAGVFSILSGHTPLLSTLTPGPLEVYNSKNERDFFAISGGFAVIDNNTVTILTEAWEHSREIDLARAQEALERAETLLKQATLDIDVPRAEAAIGRASARILAHSHEGY